MDDIYNQYKDRVEFFLVYVREAHPADGWQVDRNIENQVLFRAHQDFAERESVANSCRLGLDISIPTLIEEMDNGVDEAYGASPERLYVIDAQGKVAYHGGAGPHFFDPDEWGEAIKSLVN